VNSRGLISRIVIRKSSAEAGTVVAQNPNPGADVLRHSVVTLAVSAVQKEAVPNVVGRRSADAQAALRARGFDVKRATVVSKQPTGTVVAESPQAGSRVARGSTVTINVSRGLVAVPQAVGRQRDAAVTAIRGAGLVPKAFTVPSSQAKGIVVAQHPAAGKRVPGGSTVRLNVSSGSTSAAPPPPPPPPPPPSKPATVTVPDVTGQQQDVAQKQLNASGLKAGVVYVASNEVQGTVVSQAPEGGTTQKRGTRIQLNVSLGPRAVVKGVPDVHNLTPEDARAKLTAAGFKVQTLSQGVTDSSQIGKVVDEQPAGGKNAPAGSVVTIYVGRAA
jgi:beta-lactam-binding protein with PASTA domain